MARDPPDADRPDLHQPYPGLCRRACTGDAAVLLGRITPVQLWCRARGYLGGYLGDCCGLIDSNRIREISGSPVVTASQRIVMDRRRYRPRRHRYLCEVILSGPNWM